MTAADPKMALDRFFAENLELEQLPARLATVNVFRALRVGQADTNRTNPMRWLARGEDR